MSCNEESLYEKNRTIVTIGGMAIGFGAIILLLSAGYGFEGLVVSQIASLSEMKQIDVTVSKGFHLSLIQIPLRIFLVLNKLKV